MAMAVYFITIIKIHKNILLRHKKKLYGIYHKIAWYDLKDNHDTLIHSLWCNEVLEFVLVALW